MVCLRRRHQGRTEGPLAGCLLLHREFGVILADGKEMTNVLRYELEAPKTPGKK